MKLRILAATAAIMIAAAISNPAKADLVTNGNFGTGDFAGWTLSGDTSFNGVSHVLAPPGEIGAPTGNAAFLGTSGSELDLSQTLSTIAGQTYDLTFFRQAEAGTTAPDYFTTQVGGVTLGALSVADVGGSDWQTFDAQFTATGTSTLLNFAVSNDLGAFDLTNVSATAVPEPSALALMLVGVVGLVGYGIRRRGPSATLA
ncbi:MAG TPA: PEP-CTERM sorting domain-containing protein [Aliidongia sp.]|uniref:PEP-CTERM sorting domain-containing protein n=1 Tax=Aliidongia sp. TaxID=1914230 RepID=UPI002DDD560B|nr:PEP-CTERM sorting domain-containing protein [Aliidongia sp.]HEV2673311.1 PEP-CTERM sorting domain-containing protein [Aliidongia sp.]